MSRKRPKRLSLSDKLTLDSHVSGPTLSLNPDNLEVTKRGESRLHHPIAVILSGDRSSFSYDYISPNKVGEQVIKNDSFNRVGEDSYIEIEKDQNPDHHIDNASSIEDRLESLIKNKKDES